MTGPIRITRQRITKPYLRQAFRRNLPLIVVVGVILVAVMLVIAGRWRRGAVVLGAAALLTSFLRATTPEERIGVLAVRSRPVDVISLALVGSVIVWIALSIDPLGTD